MFSEYASRFLAKSNSQLNKNNNGGPNLPPPKPKLIQPVTSTASNVPPNPYTHRYSFPSRPTKPAAPLFHSTTQDLDDPNPNDEHQREVTDFYALQKSRAAFSSTHSSDSSQADTEEQQKLDKNNNNSGNEDKDDNDDDDDDEQSQSTHESSPFQRNRRRRWQHKKQRSTSIATSVSAAPTDASLNKSKSRLVDVDLSDSLRSNTGSSIENIRFDEEAPTMDAYYFNPAESMDGSYQDSSVGDESSPTFHRPRSLDNSILPGIAEDDEESGEVEQEPQRPVHHDVIWAQLFIIANAALLATSLLVYLHTDTPSSRNPLGDTIYTIIQKSYFLLAVDTLVAIVVAAVWLTLLRNFLRPLTFLIVCSVPVILLSFSLWPFITSFQGFWGGFSFQDKIMRIFSSLPFLSAVVWTYMAVQSRHSIDRAIDIIRLASDILSESPSLFMAGFVSLITTVAWFWLWIFMFARVFLEGHWATSAKKVFIIDVGTWWLGIYFVLMLLWTQGAISGIHRAVTAAAVSQWYFYRKLPVTTSSRDILTAAFNHATGPLFGTITLASLISLLIRIPLLVLPRRFSGLCSMCLYSLTPTPLLSLQHPLAFTYAAIHSKSLAQAAQDFSRLPFSGVNPKNKAGRQRNPTNALTAFRTAHMILHATRQIMALALGLGAWLGTARATHMLGASYAGSMYAYVIGLGAAIVGWSVLGAVEGIIGGVVDAVFVCWLSEVAATGKRHAHGSLYCREADEVFSDKWDTRADEGRIRLMS